MADDSPHPTRRDFMQRTAIAGGALAISAALPARPAHAAAAGLPEQLPLTNVGPDRVPRKPFGSTSETLSIMGIGGSALGDAPSYEEAERIAHQAIEAGIDFFDNAWEYHAHRSEEWMGRALQGKRDKVFLMTKCCSHGRGKDVALKQLDESLKRLGTDHLDLWQIHEVIYWTDPELHFRAGGAIEALLEAKRAGKTRYIGFTGHKDPRIHLLMLKLADAHGVHFDSVQMPINAFDASFRSFGRDVLPEVRRRGAAALGMKSLGGGGEAIQQGEIGVVEALRYAMSLPVATTISGIDSLKVLEQNLGVARGFKPMTPAEMHTLAEQVAGPAGDGHLELYKTTKHYDADEGRQQHGYPSPKELPI